MILSSLQSFVQRLFGLPYSGMSKCAVCGDTFALNLDDPAHLKGHGTFLTERYVCPDEACRVYAHFQEVLFEKQESKRHMRAKRRRSCYGKSRYKTQAIAMLTINRYKDPGQYSAYHCQFCGYWHIGHTMTDNRKTLMECKLKLAEMERCQGTQA